MDKRLCVAPVQPPCVALRAKDSWLCTVHKAQAERKQTFSSVSTPERPAYPITFTVDGPAATKGSTVSFLGDEGKVITKTDSSRLRAWAEAVAEAARVVGATVLARPTAIRVVALFVFAPPADDPLRTRHTMKPDIDKISRALLDALTGLCYEDDSQVVHLSAQKMYGAVARTLITIEIVS